MSNQQQYQNNNPLVGYVNAPRTEIRISFTEAELNDMRQYLTGKETKRVYITVKTGEKKDKSGSYAIASVYDPNAGQGTAQSNQYAQSKGAPAPSTSNQTDDLPF
jgi:hypothetical protein